VTRPDCLLFAIAFLAAADRPHIFPTASGTRNPSPNGTMRMSEQDSPLPIMVDQPTDAGEKARLRGQALAWLQADLVHWARQIRDGTAADRSQAVARLRSWRQDGDFAAVREKKPLAELPESERAAWDRFWREVQALLPATGPVL
jgi:hypothetical protein